MDKKELYEKVQRKLNDISFVAPELRDAKYMDIIEYIRKSIDDMTPRVLTYTFSKNNVPFELHEVVEVKDDIHDINKPYMVFKIESTGDSAKVTLVDYKIWLDNVKIKNG